MFISTALLCYLLGGMIATLFAYIIVPDPDTGYTFTVTDAVIVFVTWPVMVLAFAVLMSAAFAICSFDLFLSITTAALRRFNS